jgi:hypothetical protein
VLGPLELRHARLELRRALPEDAAEPRRLPAQLVVRDALEALEFLVDFVDDRLDAPTLPVVPGAEDAVDE